MMVVRDEAGQSVLEVVFLLPFLFTFVILVYKINLASQTAIHNTKVGRSQMFVLAANSPEYPRLGFRFRLYAGQSPWTLGGHQRLVMGVADPSTVSAAEYSDDETLQPVPQTQKIARSGTSVPGSQAAGEVTSRTEIRLRNLVSICTQFNSIKVQGQFKDLTPSAVLSLGSSRWPFNMEVCKYE